MSFTDYPDDDNGSRPVESPCIKKCVVNEVGVCIGCYRSLDEIGIWASASEQRRQQVLKNCEARQAERAGDTE